MADWEKRLAEQEQRMSRHAPAAAQTAKLKALARLEEIKARAFSMGYDMRKMKGEHGMPELLAGLEDMSIPSREMAIEPVEKSGMLGLLTGIGGGLATDVANSMQFKLMQMRHQMELRANRPLPDDPEKIPGFGVLKLLAKPKGMVEGWQAAEKEEVEKRRAELGSQVDAAKQEFERALKDEYEAGRKTASAGETIDWLADGFIKAGLTLDDLLNTYATAALPLGIGAHEMGKQYVEDVDPRALRMKAIKELLYQRMRARPPIITVKPPAVSGKKEERPAEPEEGSSDEKGD